MSNGARSLGSRRKNRAISRQTAGESSSLWTRYSKRILELAQPGVNSFLGAARPARSRFVPRSELRGRSRRRIEDSTSQRKPRRYLAEELLVAPSENRPVALTGLRRRPPTLGSSSPCGREATSAGSVRGGVVRALTLSWRHDFRSTATPPGWPRGQDGGEFAG